MSATVFMSNQSRSHDYESAMRFGAIRAVTNGNYPIFNTTRLRQEITDALIHSKPTDFLLLSGSAVISGLCMQVWFMLHGRCKLLLWDRSENEYVLRDIVADDVRLDIERSRDRLLNTAPRG